MKCLKITPQSAKVIAWQKQTQSLKKKALKKQLSFEAQEALWEEIRKGNKDTIIKLVESSEAMIYSILGQCPSDKFTVEELFTVGKNRLISFASGEPNAEMRERYFRFGAWHVRQAFAGKENEYSEIKLPPNKIKNYGKRLL